MDKLPDAAPASSRPLRDAVAALARVFFDRPEPVTIMTSWDASVTPQLLDGAARFGIGNGPLVSVFATSAQIKAGEPARADWRRARLFEAPSAGQCRGTMLQVPFRCAILIGGGKEADADGMELAHLAGQSTAGGASWHHLFAVASTGGAAARALLRARAEFGGNLSELELEKPTSYTVLMKRILNATGPSHPGRARPPSGGPSGHGWSNRRGAASLVLDPSSHSHVGGRPVTA
ncbi:MAG: hypothetical protein QM756_02310 [Polyangiaceae bacterium]